MDSLKNVENSCQLLLEAGNKDRCLIIRQSIILNTKKRQDIII